MTLVNSINSSKSPTTFHLYLYRLHIFNKLEVSRLDSRLSSFIIISSYIHTLSWCQKHTDLGKPSITVQHTAQPMTSFRTTTPSTATTGRMTTKQVNPVHVHPETSCKALLESCMHVHQPIVQVCKPGESLALRKVKHPHNGRTSVNGLPLTEQDILSQYSGCFEGIGHFPGDLYKFHLKPEHKPA